MIEDVTFDQLGYKSLAEVNLIYPGMPDTDLKAFIDEDGTWNIRMRMGFETEEKLHDFLVSEGFTDDLGRVILKRSYQNELKHEMQELLTRMEGFTDEHQRMLLNDIKCLASRY
jgi:hypothetical protein